MFIAVLVKPPCKMERQQIKNIIEAALMVAGRPLPLAHLAYLFADEFEVPDCQLLREVLGDLAEDYRGHGFELKEVAGGWRIQTRVELAPWLAKLWEERPPRFSRATLETLALIAYRQPVTRGDIEEIRGVTVSSPIIRSLLERGWIKVIGHREVPGKPALFATTPAFLDYFNLKSLDQLPPLTELADPNHSQLDLSAVPADKIEDDSLILPGQPIQDNPHRK